MNKNLFKSFAVAALSILAAGCAKEQVTGEGGMVEASFSVDVPETSIATRGISDASEINELICQVFVRGEKDENKHFIYTPVPELTQKVSVVDKKSTVKINLVKGQTYSFAFWAQVAGTGYYNTSDLRAVKMNTDVVKANDPKMDAFYEFKDEARVVSSYTKKVTLHRALAQVNFGAVASNRQDNLAVSESSVKLVQVPDTFHLFWRTSEGSADITYMKNSVISDEKLQVADKNYDYLATAYVFADNQNSILTDASATFTLSNGRTTTVTAPNAPIKINFRTNILGDLLTVDGEWNVTVDDKFQSGDLNYDSVSANLGGGATVTLTKDYSVVGESRGVKIGEGVTSTLNLNGHRFANENGNKNSKAALQVDGGTLTINGEGEVYCEKNEAGWMNREHTKSYSNNAILVSNGGHLIINGGNYSVGTDSLGKCNATIFITNVGKPGKVEIYGGTFTNDEGTNGHSYVLNQDDELPENCITVYGGKFIGFNPADNNSDGTHTNYVAEGYKSVKISESPDTWEVVDASVSVAGQTELEAALASTKTGETAYVNLSAGEFTTYNKDIAKGKILNFNGLGADKTTFVCGSDLSKTGEYRADYSLENSDVTFKNLTLNVGNANYLGFIRPISLVFENCTIVGRLSYMGTGKVIFKNCTFNQTAEDYNLWTYSGNEFMFENCTFNSVGKFINVYKEQAVIYKITIKDCKFISSKVNKSALELKANGGDKYEVYFDGTNTCENINESQVTGSMLYNSNDGETDSIVYIDGKKVWGNGAKVE